VRVEFVQPRPHGKTIERHLGCPVVCGVPDNAIVFRAVDAQRPFVTRNAELLAMLAPQFEEELKRENAGRKAGSFRHPRGYMLQFDLESSRSDPCHSRIWSIQGEYEEQAEG
jgi:hypothetical protein